MKATSVSVNVGVTKNMGNYESLRIDYEMTVELNEGEVPADVIDGVRDSLAEKIRNDLASSDGGRDWLKKQ